VIFKDKKAIECLLFDKTNNLVFSGGANHEIKVSYFFKRKKLTNLYKVFDSSTKKSVLKFQGHKGGVFGLAKMGRNHLISCSGDQTIKV